MNDTDSTGSLSTTTQVARARSVLAHAHTALTDVTRGVAPDQWSSPTPCSEWDVTQVLQHAVGDQQAYVRGLTGSGGPTDDPFAPSGSIDGDPVSFVANAIAAAATAWGDADGDTVSTPLPQGELPLWVAMGAAALDALVHAWDVAVATGQASPLSDEDAVLLLDVAHQLVEPLRQWGVYGPAVEAGPDPSARLLGYLGRDPEWTR